MTDIKRVRDEAFKKLNLNEVNSGVYNGKWLDYNPANSIESVSPIDGTFLSRISVATESDYDKTIQIISRAFVELVMMSP